MLPVAVALVNVSPVKLGVEVTAIVAFVVPETTILEPAVSSAVTFWNVGADEPPDVSSWFDDPTALLPYADPSENSIEPALPIVDVAVPPRAIGSMPEPIAVASSVVVATFVTRPFASTVITVVDVVEP